MGGEGEGAAEAERSEIRDGEERRQLATTRQQAGPSRLLLVSSSPGRRRPCAVPSS